MLDQLSMRTLCAVEDVFILGLLSQGAGGRVIGPVVEGVGTGIRDTSCFAVTSDLDALPVGDQEGGCGRGEHVAADILAADLKWI